MTVVLKAKGALSVKAYQGDAKTLLAFNVSDKNAIKNLAGFSIRCQPGAQDPYYIHNNLCFEKPGDHAQDAKESPFSSINAPIHKFRWIHIPGSVHQGLQPFLGKYVYTVTPRYFDEKGALLPLDPQLGVSVTIDVEGFAKGKLELGFTRGYTQSQAFTHHFGKDARLWPEDKELIFDTSAAAGVNAHGDKYTYEDEYQWLGFTAREKILGLLKEVHDDPTLVVDVFAYDLNETSFVSALLELGKEGRARVILDNAALHHSASSPKPEDEFAEMFEKQRAAHGAIKRGKFGRYAHDKVIVVYKNSGSKKKPIKVLTGSTNFSLTGLYVNSNHVLVYNDAEIAGFYAGVFNAAWDGDVKRPAFVDTDWSTKTFSSHDAPKTDFAFSPHSDEDADRILGEVADRIAEEGKKKGKAIGNVLFAVMQLSGSDSPVYAALKDLRANDKVFSFGISDSPDGVYLYPIGKKTGARVTGKPANTILPPPFDQVRAIPGVGHQVHHKFVVCGFNGDDPTVVCGSSNLASGGEKENGDNLLVIRDADVATVFTIEALALVDHFNFLDRSSPRADSRKIASLQQAALNAGWYLSTTDKWTQKYFDPNDLHSVDRTLFGI